MGTETVLKRNIGLGIIGVGRWGKNYLRTFSMLTEAEVRWICSSSATTLQEALAVSREGRPEGSPVAPPDTTTEYREILEDESVEAVCIATPGSTHAKIAKEALSAGKHVLVEKPVAFRVQDVERLIKLADREKKILMVGHLHRYNPAIQELKDDIRAGLFGKIHYVNSIGAGGPVREDMSALWDYLPHDLSILLYLLEEMPTEVHATGAYCLKPKLADVVSLTLNFPDKLFATCLGSWLYPTKKRELTIVSDRLYAIFDDYAPDWKLKYYDPAHVVDKKGLKCYSPPLEARRPLTEQLNHFLECIAKQTQPWTDGRDALRVTSVLEAAERSLRKDGAPTKVHEPKPL